VAYLLSEGGDEESLLRVLDVATGEVIDGPIDRTRYTEIAWVPGGGEYLYVRRLPPKEVPEGEAAFHRRLWRHRVGADPDGDEMVFGDGLDKTAYLGVDTSEDGRWGAVTVSLGTAPRNDLFVARLDGGGLDWVPALVGEDATAWPHFDRRGALWLVTDRGAPRRKLCRVDPARPEPGHWSDVVAEDPDGAVLEGYALAEDTLLVLHSHHAVSRLRAHDRETGAFTAEVALPGPGTADLTGRPDEGPEVWVGYTDDVTPYSAVPLDKLGVRAARAGLVAQQVTYRSADGTEVRMRVIAPTGRPDGPRPTILYGYGGFTVPMTPAYSSSILAWVEAGGVWAIAQLRGGSEEGEAWHRAGMRQNKFRVYEDFEAAGDWLVAEGWTTRERLGIFGGSNGGLLVGAALTRSPSRWAAVVCSAPLLDMIRYERFGLGTTWSDEYGRAEDATEFAWLWSYSPYHHVDKGVEYPAVLFTVFDADTRVDPLHARKMAAALQWATASDPSDRPVLLRREEKVGHGARSVSRSVDLAADELGFFARQLGLDLSS
jgi:prolyl oligopeptidase